MKISGLNKLIFIILSFSILHSCKEYGKVDQGRVIDYDKEKRIVTIVHDRRINPERPDYILPPRKYLLPDDPLEMGPEPKAGKRIKLDIENNQVIIFDDKTQSFKAIPYQLVEKKVNIEKDHPLVYDKKERKSKEFPIIDREKKTITIYSRRQEILVIFTLPDEYFTLPDETWALGDEVRIFYHEEGKALRFMNITKTDIFKK